MGQIEEVTPLGQIVLFDPVTKGRTAVNHCHASGISCSQWWRSMMFRVSQTILEEDNQEQR